MATGIRINSAKNFAGDFYATQRWVLAELTKLGLGTDFDWAAIHKKINDAIEAVDKKFGTMVAGRIATANDAGSALEYVNNIVTAVGAEATATDANIPTEKAVRTAIDKIAKEIIGVAAGDGITIELVDGNNVISNALRLEAIEVKDTDSDKDTVSKRYALVHGEGNAKKTVGDIINIPKDQFLKNAKFEGKSLVLTFNLVNGESNEVTIPLDDLVDVYKAGNGLSDERVTADGTFFDVKIDTASEKLFVGTKDAEGKDVADAAVIDVGTNGVKVSNVQKAIDYAVTTKAAEIAEDVAESVNAVKKVAIQLSEVTIDVTLVETDKGVFSTTVAGRVLSVYDAQGEIYPEITYNKAANSTTITAEFAEDTIGEKLETWTAVVAEPIASN